jgi:hypothetical protein
MRTLGLLLLAGCGEAPLTDLDGREARPAPTSVYVFLQPGCPIAERYAPEIIRLRDAFPVAAFWVVYPGTRFSLDALRAHRAAYLPGFPALRDPGLRLARRCRVTVTPEAAVVTARDGLVYHGRIDDLFADLDIRRPAPTRRDLELTLAALSRGEPAPASAPAVGCPVTE